MSNLLNKVSQGDILSNKEAYSFISKIETGQISAEEISGVLVAIQMRGLHVSELQGFTNALIDYSINVDLPAEGTMDLCGTGGDGKNTFNISTTTALVLAAMGRKIIKHGNYGLSSICGSSNVLEQLGFKFSASNSDLNRQLKEKNIAILHAPLFHPTLKKVGPIRKNLGIRTLFNALGPLVNPVQPEFQVTGTFSLDLAYKYQEVLNEKRKSFKVMYGLDGFDELSLTAETVILSKQREERRNSKSFNTTTLNDVDLIGGETVKEASKMVQTIIQGKGNDAQTSVIAANVAEALNCFDSNIQLTDAYQESIQFIRSGQTAKHFNLN
jgi:anthranilate phosphoribosyltransferase